MDISNLNKIFFEKYNNRNEKPVIFFSPGRVNLIGEHTDYNGGFVFPCAINYGTYLVIRKTEDPIIRFSTLNFNEDSSVALPAEGLFVNTGQKWINYPLGVMNEFIARGAVLPGMDLLFSGDIPNGAGLSSSASIEMVTAVALNELLDQQLDMLELVKMSQRAENHFVGMNCGIMDQFAVGFGSKDHAIALDCDTLEYKNVPLILGGHSLIIANTNKRRGLTDSKYNERRAECESAVELLQTYRPLRNLGELDSNDIPALGKFIDDAVIRKRAHHVITENARVKEAVKVLMDNDLRRFGELMTESHDSLRDDYEVTGFELDTLAGEAIKLPGVLGSRMTGAGFGGCTVSIVESGSVDQFISELGRIYFEKTGLKADFYRPLIGDGARMIYPG